MMTFDRMHTDNELIRPETSKYSRSSKRSQFNSTLTNFNTNSNQNGANKSNVPKHETQTNFYSSNGNNTKANGLSSTQYDPKTGFNKKKNNQPPKQEKIEPTPPETNKPEGTEAMSSSVGFRLTSGEIKKGVTLDKVLGAGFKKIDIYDANLREFENNTFLPISVIDEKINEMSEVEEKYGYESFEILETENEEEGNPESQHSQRGYNHKEERKEFKERPRIDQADEVKNNEILDRIQKKYKSSKSKQIYKHKSKLIAKLDMKSENGTGEYPPGQLSSDRESENPQPPIHQQIQQQQQQQQLHQQQIVERRGRDSALGKMESKSLSPKLNQEMKKPRFQATGYENTKPIGATQYNGYNNTPFRNSKQQFYPKNEVKQETQANFRTSSTSFRTTKESFKGDAELTSGFNNNNYVKKNFGTTKLANNSIIEPEKEKPVHEFDKTNNRSNSMINAEQFTETAMKYYSDKNNHNHLEQKFLREKQLMNQKIKKNEIDMIDKYSKLFKFNNEEKLYLYKEDRKDAPKRLSTPMKDFDANRGFNRKKFMNL